MSTREQEIDSVKRQNSKKISSSQPQPEADDNEGDIEFKSFLDPHMRESGANKQALD